MPYIIKSKYNKLSLFTTLRVWWYHQIKSQATSKCRFMIEGAFGVFNKNRDNTAHYVHEIDDPHIVIEIEAIDTKLAIMHKDIKELSDYRYQILFKAFDAGRGIKVDELVKLIGEVKDAGRCDSRSDGKEDVQHGAGQAVA